MHKGKFSSDVCIASPDLYWKIIIASFRVDLVPEKLGDIDISEFAEVFEDIHQLFMSSPLSKRSTIELLELFFVRI